MRIFFVVGALIAFVVYPLAPAIGRQAVLLLMATATFVAIGVGMRRTDPVHRRAWVLLLVGLALVYASTAGRLIAGGRPTVAGQVLDVAGYLLLFAAAMALVLNHGRNNLGVVIDTAIAALAAGGVLWTLVLRPRLLPGTYGLAKLGFLIIILALLATLGAVIQLDRIRPTSALAELITAVLLALCGNVEIAIASDVLTAASAGMAFIGAYLAIGLFGLNPLAPALFTPAPARPERLSVLRLVLLGVAIAVTPTLLGTQQLVDGELDGLLLLVSSVAITMLVVARIAQLSAQRDRAEQALRDQAAQDPLTGLPNRREFQAQLDQLTKDRKRPAILFCDLDRFKAVNDRYGHAGGDEVLTEVAHRLRTSVRTGDVVCRYGGDEFVILLPGITADELEAVSQRIDRAIGEPFQFDGRVITVGATIGAAMATADSNADDLVTRADHAMYDHKRA